MRVCPLCHKEYFGNEVFCSVDGAHIEEVPAAHSVDPLVGTVLEDRYRIIRQIGEGGMGVVYEAEHVGIEKRVALKLLREDFSSKSDVVERFRQEARSASRIGNPHIVDVTDFGRSPQGGVFFVMELLDGQALSDISRDEIVPLERMVRIVDQIARALQAAHDKGIIHRDLKPENIYVLPRDDQREFVKILDFGIAKMSDEEGGRQRLTQTGMIFGTPAYMSPEQAAGKGLDHRVDIYALGCIMFEMVTGAVPYTGESFMAILTQHMFEPVPDIRQRAPDTDTPLSVQQVIYRAMAKDPADRYPDMQSLREDLAKALLDADYQVTVPDRDQSVSFSLKRLLGDEGRQRNGAVPKPEPTVTPGRLGGRRRRVLTAGVGIGLAVVIGVALYRMSVSRTQMDIDEAVGVREVPGESGAAGFGAIGAEDLGMPEGHWIVTLGSIPPGATIVVEEMGQVCSETPCEVRLPGGKTLDVTARVGDRAQSAKFTPSAHNRELIIEIPLPKTDSPERIRDKSPRRVPKRSTERTDGSVEPKKDSGLKVPELFRSP